MLNLVTVARQRGPGLGAAQTKWLYFFLAITAISITACSSAPVASSKHMPTPPVASSAIDYASLTPVDGFSTCRLQPEDFALLTDIAQGRLVPDSHNSDSDGRIALTIREMNQWLDKSSQLDTQPVQLVLAPKPSPPVFVALFDGTWNDRDDKSSPTTVVGHLSFDLEKMNATVNDLKIKYYPGVGTRTSWVRHLWQGITGSGAKERAEEALRDLQEFSARGGNTPHIYAIGFSRGAASARHFLNLVDEMLNAIPADNENLNRSRSFALLFDTVATGQINNLKLTIPSSTASVFHFVATRERRLSFPVVNLQPAGANSVQGQDIIEVELPAAHSDLGGGYGRGLEKLAYVMARGLLERQGFEFPKQPLDEQAVLNMGRHNSDWPGTKLANAVLSLAHPPQRLRVDPTDSAKSTPLTDPSFALLEQSARQIEAAKLELSRTEEASRSGKLPAFDGISIQLQKQGSELVLTTNCPRSVAFDRRSRWLLFNGQRYKQITEDAIHQAENGYGIVLIVDRQNGKDFRPASSQ